MAKSGQYMPQRSQPLHFSAATTCGGWYPVELKAEESARTWVGQNSTQNPHPLQRSTVIATWPLAMWALLEWSVLKSARGGPFETMRTGEDKMLGRQAQWPHRQTRSSEVASRPSNHDCKASSMGVPAAAGATSARIPCAANDTAAPCPMPPVITASHPASISTKVA